MKKIRVIAFQEGDLWVAQCLEYDIGAQAATLPELKKRLSFAIEAELDESMAVHGVPFHGIPSAPEKYEGLWKDSSGGFKSDSSLAHNGNHVEIDYALCA